VARAERNSYKSVLPEYFSDFFITFERNPVTGLLKKVTNEDSIKQAVILTVLTTLGERFYQPHFGSKLETSLFEFLNNETIDLIRHTIEVSLKNFEPRVTIIGINVGSDIFDEHSIAVTVQFECVNIPDKLIEVDIPLTRIR
jgi:phage baseplate assembly protein W